jgi:hypothetical protein
MTDDCWSLPEIGWPEIRIHPMHLTDADDIDLLRLWRAWDGGHGPLPETGGQLDQPAAVMTAFAIMTAAEGALRKTRYSDHG